MSFLNQYQINILRDLTLEAGKIAMSHFGNQNLIVKRKGDNSPVTIADSEVSNFIGKNLKQNFPHIEIICEEGENRKVSGSTFWLIDPIDGTKSFIENNPEFTINIALIKNNVPIFGTIYAPAIEGSPLYYNDENNQIVKFLFSKQQKLIIKNKSDQEKNFNVITSKSTKDEDVINYFQNNLTNLNSRKLKIIKMASSFKFCSLIEGAADLYLHFRKSMEWDIAAGNALILSCEGVINNLDGTELMYNKKDFMNQAFLAKIKSTI